MLRFVLIIGLFLQVLNVMAQGADDAAFKRQMEDYERRLKAVQTPAEGLKILNEMQAKQQAYLSKKTDTVRQIKNAKGVDQIQVGANQMAFKAGNAKFEDNPLFVKCKVELSFNTDKSDSRNDNQLQTHAQSKYSGSGKATIRTYMMHYMGRYVLAEGEDAIRAITASGSIIASGSDQSPNSHSQYTQNGMAISKPGPILGFTYESDEHWSATGKLHYNGSRTDGRGTQPENLDDGWDAESDNATITRNGNSFVITRRISEHKADHNGSVVQNADVSGTFSMTITPEQTEKYTAYFDFAGGNQAYEQWMPEGFQQSNHQHGNFIDVKVRVESTSKPGVDLSNQIRYIKWELPSGEVSRVIGYANNAPTYDHFSFNVSSETDYRSKLADLQLHVPTELADSSVEVLKATSTAANNYMIRVYSFDYGAYGKLIAHVVLADSSEIVCTDRTSGSPYLLLPKRDGDSRVATYFKKINQVLDKKDGDDDERMPGTDKYPGDGFTLYEEYRGFMENGRHFRGDPRAKDVMIYNTINTDRSRDGISTYELVLNNYTGNSVKTHHRFTKEEFGRRRNDWTETEKAAGNEYGVMPIDPDKCLNFNFIPELHVVDQHGIGMLKTDKKLGFALASPNVGGLCGPPANYDFLVVSADFKDDSSGWSRTRADVDSNGGITVNPNGSSLIITDEYARTVAHEMLHNSGVNHHGDNGEYNNNKPSEIVYMGHSLWRINGSHAVTLYWEDAPGVAIDTLDRRFVNYLKQMQGALFISIWHGTASGFEDCIMRYDNPDAYCKTASSTEIYIIPRRTTHRELSGTHLCTSGKGTGVNASTHVPISRYSDADEGMGNCISQFCVNDKFAH